ncbi:MAG: TonB-dependent receptor [Steroidobacteraceae bacterium]
MTKEALDSGRERQGSAGNRSRHPRRLTIFALSVTLAFAFAGTAWAQQPPAAQATTGGAAEGGDQLLQEVVVTAEKRSESVQDVPLSVTAYTGDALQEAGITSLADLAAETAGVSEKNSGPGQTEFEMRGVSSSGGEFPTVGVYLDDTPVTPPAAAQLGKVVIDPSLYDLNRVEVLRGPQGTLYGEGSMGGTIRLITNQPDTTAFAMSGEATGSGTQGAGGNYAANVMLNIPLVSDVVALRLVATDKYTDGWIDRIVESPFPEESDGGLTRGNVLAAPVAMRFSDVNWERLQGGRAELLAQPTERLTISASFLDQRITQGGWNYADVPPGLDEEAHYQPFDVPEPYSDAFDLASLTIKYDFDGFEITSATGEYRRGTHLAQDSTETMQDFFWTIFGLSDLPYSAVGPLGTYSEDWTSQTTEELRITSTGNGRFQWIVGGFYQDFSSADDVGTNTPGPIVDALFGVPSLYDINYLTHFKQFAGFGEASYNFFDALKLTAGLRYYSYKTNEFLAESGGIPNGSLIPTTFNEPASDSGVNPKVNLSHRWGEDLTVYTQAVKGSRPGGGNTPAPGVCTPVPPQYNPDSLWSYELGEKAQLLDRRLTLNSAVYYENWSGIQQIVAEPCGFTYTTNAGKTEVRGGEIELAARVTPYLSLSTAGGYTDARITQTGPGSSFTVGEKIQEVPTWTDSTSIMYHHAVSERYELVLRATNEYVGPMTDVSFSVNNVPGRDLLSLRAGLVREDSLSAFLFIDNATDRRVILGNSISLSVNGPTFNRVVTNQPRTIGIDLSYSFGGHRH